MQAIKSTCLVHPLAVEQRQGITMEHAIQLLVPRDAGSRSKKLAEQ